MPGARDGIEWVAIRLAENECVARLEAGHPMRAVEAYIDSLSVADEQRRALRARARSHGERLPPW